MKGLYKFLWFLLLAASSGLQAQVSFTSSVSRDEIPLNDHIRVDFSMNQDGDNLNAPSFEGFKMVGGPQQSVSSSNFNGKISFNKTYSFFLAPTRKGKITIGSASIQINGETYKTEPLTITVTDAVKREDPKTRLNQSQEAILKGIHLVAEISNSKPFQNEPISIYYKIYVESGSNIVNWAPVTIPQYENFWVNPIDIKELKVERGTYNGKDAQFITLKKDVLMPLESGEIQLNPLELEVQVEVPTGRRSFFGYPETGYIKQTFSTGTKKIQVSPLPESGKPENFSGAVGQFDFKVTPNNTQVDALQSIEVSVEVSGQGNMNLFQLPNLTASQSLEIYDPIYSEKVRSGTSGIQGKKTNTYTLIPQYKGDYTIDPLTFSYFDVKSKSYKVITTDSINIHVENGPEIPTREESFRPDPESQFETFQPNASVLKWRASKTSSYWNSLLFYILTLLPLVLIPLIVVINSFLVKQSKDFEGIRSKQNNKLARKYLSAAKKNLKSKDKFYEALERCLHNFLKAKLNIETSDMSQENIEQILTTREIENDTIRQFIDLKNACEYARYTPSSQLNMQRDYENAILILAQLDKQFK